MAEASHASKIYMSTAIQPLGHKTADVVVIGGGATGLGIARDASLRGFKVILIEKGELGHGTSGHFHGLLHSGARYVVDDPATAIECFKEGQILRQIAKPALRDTGGFFLALSDAEAAYGTVLEGACREAGIPIEEIAPSDALVQEPRLTKALKRVFAVPDGYVDGAALLALNRLAAEETDVPAEILTHHDVTGFRKANGRLEAVIVQDLQTSKAKTIECDFVINAAGVWAGRISRLAGAAIELVLDKGAMVVLEGSLHTAVFNRCRPQADGDILVPTGSCSIMGTTSCLTTDIDRPAVTQKEITFLLHEGNQMLPGLSSAQIKTVFAGIRPLFGGSTQTHGVMGRNISRSFQVIDHEPDAGIVNFISVVGGKVTIYRRMAEAAVDKMCKKQGLYRPCKTAQTPLCPTVSPHLQAPTILAGIS